MSIMNIVTAVAVILMISVLTVVAIRFGYKALLIEWAIDAISKAEKEFVGTKLGEARLAVVVSWLREKGACTDSFSCDGRFDSQSSPDSV